MMLDSVKRLRLYLILLIFLTFSVFLNLVWSSGYLYTLVNFNAICQGNCYKPGNRLDEMTKKLTEMDTDWKFKIAPTIQKTSLVTRLNSRHDPMKVNVTIMAIILRSTTSPIVQQSNQTNGFISSQSENRAHIKSTIKPANRPDTCKNCFQHNFKYIIQNEVVCNPAANSASVDLIVLVFTVHHRFKQREIIRETWLSLSRGNTGSIRHVFLLGDSSNNTLRQAVELENNVYHDIIKESFVDSYRNLTYKTIMGFKWVTRFCSNARFVMKTDDDMYVNIPAILKILEKHKTALQTSVSGACYNTAAPIRDHRSKWFASIREYPKNTYPGFCSGTGYVTSRTVAGKIYEVSQHIPFFYLEDIYVSLCVKQLGFKLRNLPGFHNYRTRLDPCEMKSDRILTSHEIPTDFLITIRDAKCN